MIKLLRAILVLAVLGGIGVFAGIALANGPPSSPPGQGECQHGNSGQECKPDPQPEHGKDCEEHGNQGGVNEDHCLGETNPPPTNPPPTNPPPTQPPPTTTDPTPPAPPVPPVSPPSGPACPDGGANNAGKDGVAGNDACARPVPPTTPASAPASTGTVTTASAGAGTTSPPVATKPKPKPKPTSTPGKPAKGKPHTAPLTPPVRAPAKKAKAKVKVKAEVKTCPPGERMFQGKCHGVVRGNG
jgi:hypothetical protein